MDAMAVLGAVNEWAGMVIFTVTVGGMLVLLAEVAVVTVWRIVRAWRMGAR